LNAYVWILLVSCAGSALIAGLILARDAESPGNRRAALLCVCTSFWAMCEVAWNTTLDPGRALFLVRLSAPGWIFIGPMAMHVLLEATEGTTSRDRRVLRGFYVGAAVMLGVEWTTPWIHEGVIRTEWGWAYEFGPLFPAFYSITIGGLAYGLVRGIRHFIRTASPGERRQGGWVLAAIGVPLVTASATDGLLPYFGIQPPRFGSLSVMLLGALIAWSIHRYGYSLLAPGRFAPAILEALSDGVVLVRPNGDVRNVNRAMADLAERSFSSLVGQPLADLLPFVPIEPLEEVEGLEGVLLTRRQHPIPVSVSTSVLRDKVGLSIGLVLVVRDMRELRDLRSRLVISGRLAAVGELAAGIAHEINNPIAYVRANLGMLSEHWEALALALEKEAPRAGVDDLVAEGEELIEESLVGVNRVAEIVRDVKGISHTGSIEPQPVDLHPVLDRVLRVAGHQLDARVERDLAPVPAVWAPPQELEQVFLNLVLNAGQAAAPGGRIRVSTEVDGAFVVVEIEDDGVGIEHEHLDRIFDPFFTTKPQGEGTGLGLAISYQIVSKLGGRITAESQPGQGATFSVWLPIAVA
jgi:signal transduction histidine kinase